MVFLRSFHRSGVAPWLLLLLQVSRGKRGPREQSTTVFGRDWLADWGRAIVLVLSLCLHGCGASNSVGIDTSCDLYCLDSAGSEEESGGGLEESDTGAVIDTCRIDEFGAGKEQRDEGSLCVQDSECAEGLVCRPSGEDGVFDACWNEYDLLWKCGACLPPGAAGDNCEESSDCMLGYQCPGGERIEFHNCLGELGSACDPTVDECAGEFWRTCVPGLHCELGPSGSVCQEGEPPC